MEYSFGFVGVGTMNAAIVRGIATLPAPPKSLVLSPRGAARAAELSAEFGPLVTVAKDNQAVVDASDVVFVGVLPRLGEEVLRALRFSERHTVVSLLSTMPLAEARRRDRRLLAVPRSLPCAREAESPASRRTITRARSPVSRCGHAVRPCRPRRSCEPSRCRPSQSSGAHAS